MNKLFLITLCLLGTSKVFAADDTSIRQVCASYTSEICVEAKFTAEPNSTDEGEFILKIQTPSGTEAANVKIDIWMQMGEHGHGSAPVQITRISENTYKVENAWFVMKGTWLLRANFDVAQTSYKLNLPVNIKQ